MTCNVLTLILSVKHQQKLDCRIITTCMDPLECSKSKKNKKSQSNKSQINQQQKTNKLVVIINIILLLNILIMKNQQKYKLASNIQNQTIIQIINVDSSRIDQMKPDNYNLKSINNLIQLQSPDSKQYASKIFQYIAQRVNSINDSEEEIKQYLFEVLSNYSIFQEIFIKNKLAYKQLIYCSKIQKYNKGKIVTMIAERAHKFYFILKGKLSVYQQADFCYYDTTQSNQQSYMKQNIQLNNKMTNQMINKYQLSQMERQLLYGKQFRNKKEIKELFPDLIKIKVLNQYESIQENSLKKNLRSPQMIITDQPCILVTLSKKNYTTVMNKFQNIKIYTQERKKLIKFFDFFENQKKIDKYFVYFEKCHYKKGQIIYKKDDEPSAFYMICSGEVQLHVQVQIKKSESKIDLIQHQESEIQSKQLGVCLLSAKNFFGEEQLLKKYKRKTTAVCTSAFAEMLFLTKNSFYIILNQLSFRQKVQQHLQLKISYRQKIIRRTTNIRQIILDSNQISKINTLADTLTPKSFIKNRRLSTITNRKSFDGSCSYKIVHGHKVYSNKDTNQKFQDKQIFSMLAFNNNNSKKKKPLKKTREYMKKKNQKKQIPKQSNKIQNVLTKGQIYTLSELVSKQNQKLLAKECKQYFDRHNRFLYQLHTTKALRPKTTLTYKNKLSFINNLICLSQSSNNIHNSVY